MAWESSSVSDEFGTGGDRVGECGRLRASLKFVGLEFGSFLITMVFRGSVLGIGLKERGTRVLDTERVLVVGTAGSRKMVGEHEGAEGILLLSD